MGPALLFELQVPVSVSGFACSHCSGDPCSFLHSASDSQSNHRHLLLIKVNDSGKGCKTCSLKTLDIIVFANRFVNTNQYSSFSSVLILINTIFMAVSFVNCLFCEFLQHDYICMRLHISA